MDAIDLFAGAGGFTEGASLAGVRVVWAANHNPVAVRTHATNHPDAIHVCQDLHQADWRDVPRHDLLLASPACQGHSKARGKERPHHDSTRSTAWAVVSALEYHRSEIALVENVPDFKEWALFPAWAGALSALGYALAPYEVDAADFGVPQNRERLMMVLTRSRHPLKLKLPKMEHQPFAPLIEWDRYAWSDVAAKVPATRERIARGRTQFGARFLAPYYGSGSGKTGRDLNRPIGTITTLDRWALIDGERMRMLQPSELRAGMGFRSDYILPADRRTAIFQLGNAVPPPMAAGMIEAIRAAA
ncbi:MAG: DNA cytosine methyltransferase [Magnetospirillum sp.]|nr:DNA cytosine methyltransferase [Magnetospirillum sp.]